MNRLNLGLAHAHILAYANDTDAFVPELWANESLIILEENMVMASLVHRDFEDLVQNFGDIVNTRRPAEFVAKRKTNDDTVTIQDATATNVQVPLDQHFHTSFIIKDGEESKSFKDLVTEFLRPAMISIARAVDLVISGQVYQFLTNVAGTLGSAATKADLLGVREVMNRNKVLDRPRNLVLTPDAESDLLAIEAFVEADKVGDDGTALREASLGRKFGFDIFMAQNQPEVQVGNTLVAGMLVNNVAGYAKGDTVLTVDGAIAAADSAIGLWITVEGDDIPQQITAIVGDPVTSITISPGLDKAVADNAPVTIYVPGAVNLAAGYAIGFSKEIVVDGFVGNEVQVGQLVRFGDGSVTDDYAVIDVNVLAGDTIGITLDRPLAVALLDNAEVNIGPAGSYSFAFHRNALALVIRPLAAPKAGAGALSSVASHNGVAIRVVITYDGDKQGHLVTLDLLCGVAILDTNLGAVMVS